MNPIKLLQNLVYMDIGYMADLFEVVNGESPKTIISKNQGGKAGTAIPFFSAEVSAQETRSFTVSSFGMIEKLLPVLDKENFLDPTSFRAEMPSQFGWITGELTVFKMRSTSRDSKTGEDKLLASEALFQIRPKPGVDYALITTPEYFSTGFGTFVKLQDTLLKEMSIPVRAYVRVAAARGHMDQWVAMPLLILERQCEI